MILEILMVNIIFLSDALSRKKSLVFLAIACGVNALYVMYDIAGGAYGALMDVDSGILPTQRISADMMVLNKTHYMASLYSLDYRNEFYHIYLYGFMLSIVTGLHYIPTYVILIRLIHVVLWALIGVLLLERFNYNMRFGRLFRLLLVTSILLLASNGGYTEFGFSFELFMLLMFSLLPTITGFKSYSQRGKLIAATLLSATLAISSMAITIPALAIFLLSFVRDIQCNRKFQCNYLGYSMIFLARLFLLTNLKYTREYSTYFLSLIHTIANVLHEEIVIRENLYFAGSSIVDKVIDSLSTYAMFSFLTITAVLSAAFLFRKKRKSADSLFIASAVSYLALFFFAIGVFTFGRVGLFTSSRDIGVYWFLFPIAPIIFLSFEHNNHDTCLHDSDPMSMRCVGKKRKIPILLVVMMVMASLSPLYALKGNIKTLYESSEGVVDMNDYLIITNKLYNFIVFHVPTGSTLLVDPSVYPLLWHELPLRYNLNETGSTLERLWRNVDTESQDITYDAILYQIIDAGQRNLVIASKAFGKVELVWSQQIKLGMVKIHY
jgi:hypothetical protein